MEAEYEYVGEQPQGDQISPKGVSWRIKLFSASSSFQYIACSQCDDSREALQSMQGYQLHSRLVHTHAIIGIHTFT